MRKKKWCVSDEIEWKSLERKLGVLIVNMNWRNTWKERNEMWGQDVEHGETSRLLCSSKIEVWDRLYWGNILELGVHREILVIALVHNLVLLFYLENSIDFCGKLVIALVHNYYVYFSACSVSHIRHHDQFLSFSY